MKRAGLIAALVITGLTGRAATSQAQPALNPPAEAPAAANPLADWGRLTPEQQKQAVKAMTEQWLRGSMTHLGYTDHATQDAVVLYAQQTEQALEPVRARHRQVAQALLGNTLPDHDIQAMLTDLRASIDQFHADRKQAMVDLDTRIHFTQKPRLDAMLSMLGLTRDETASIGGVTGGTLASLAAGWAPPPPAAPAQAAPDH